MSALSDAIARCRLAYAMNNIPWDGTIARLGTTRLNDLAEYWERRADPDFALTIREGKKMVDRALASIPCRGSLQASAAIRRSERCYHGGDRE